LGFVWLMGVERGEEQDGSDVTGKRGGKARRPQNVIEVLQE
jgi:hypothetical protein